MGIWKKETQREDVWGFSDRVMGLSSNLLPSRFSLPRDWPGDSINPVAPLRLLTHICAVTHAIITFHGTTFPSYHSGGPGNSTHWAELRQ